MKNKYLILLTVMLSLIISQKSEALSCGDSISENLTLSADLICDTNTAALNVIADRVTLNLNGFTIRGAGRGKGIQIYDSIGVRVTGGKIRRFSTGIFAVRTIGLKINNIEFKKMETAISIGDGKYSRIYDNTISKMNTGVLLSASSGFVAYKHRIENNIIFNSKYGIILSRSQQSTIVNNEIYDSEVNGIELQFGYDNQVLGNFIFDSGYSAIKITSSSINSLVQYEMSLKQKAILI